MTRLFVLLFLLASPLVASTFTATTHSEGGSSCSKVNQPDPVTCDSGSTSPVGGGGGEVTAFAGFEPGSMALANLDLAAVCHTLADCLTQSGSADAELDLAIHGLAGTPGLLEFTHIAFAPGGFGTTSLVVTGLTVFSLFGPHSGTVYNFTYEQPFHLSAQVQGSCSECGDATFPVHISARLTAPFFIYDLNLNLLSTISSPLEAQPAPEPGTLTILSAGLLFLAWLALRRRNRHRHVDMAALRR